MAHISPSPAAQEQLKLLEEIVSSGNGSKKLCDAVKKLAEVGGDKSTAITTTTTTMTTATTSTATATASPSILRALRTLPITSYEPDFAAACSRAIDALRSIRDGGDGGGGGSNQSDDAKKKKEEEYERALAELFADAGRVDVRGFGVTSGTSGAARKVFPQTADAVDRRNAFFALKPPLVAAGETRLNLFVPARPEVLSFSSPSPSSSSSSCSPPTPNWNDSNNFAKVGDGSDRVTMGPVTAVLFDPWIRKLEEILDGDDDGEEDGKEAKGGEINVDGSGKGEKNAVDPATDVDPVRGGERQSYPLAVTIAKGVDVEQRLYLIWLCTLARGGARVALVSDTFGGSTLNAVRVLRSFGKEIARDLRAGRLSEDFFGTEKEKDAATKKEQEKLRRAVDLYIAEPRPREARELENALASEGKNDEDEETGLLAKLLPNVRFVSAIFTGSMSKYLHPMRALLRRRRMSRRSPQESTAGAEADAEAEADAPAVVITEFYGGSEGTYGVNEALLARRECFASRSSSAIGGKGASTTTTTTSATTTTMATKPPLQLPEPQRFVAMTGVDAFLEFLPIDDGGEDKSTSSAPSPKQPLSIVDGEIPINRSYELVVTNFMGLARYRVGDVVRVVGTFEPPTTTAENVDDPVEKIRGAPVFEFVGRAGSALNLVWEKYDEGALLAAVADAAAALVAASRSSSSPSSSSVVVPPWKDFAAREDVGRGGEKDRYVFYLEPPSSSSISSEEEKEKEKERQHKAWADALERSLRARNDVYRMLTSRGQIAPLRVCVVSSGTFDALRDAAVASGTAHAQYKAPVVVEADAEAGKRTRVLEERVVARVDAEC